MEERQTSIMITENVQIEFIHAVKDIVILLIEKLSANLSTNK